ncbi:MAG: hypothetical protein BGO45_04590 [Microbacterium sp. 71-36]|uniref:hypothetical protein n=1 Tax=unclassified Microbacterium TaxID=2609290 RepID=UPI00086A8E61|nr:MULTISPECIES: hypothetical protein [unclassified Microbacterium]MBN9210503.1 hypothetical protein [Microbacterium sp.]ODT43222.1 MAG: hypothetical protein ABS60_00275 [Microbacterium sp. SCN 71-17]OJV75777.1 MAG: hypothetical protein BGO45_04590 [Microbacterium sp. 71-36]
MSIRYADGEHNAASGTREAFGRFSDDLVAAGLPPITVVSGDREPAEQVDLFVTRFLQQATGSGPFGDVRWWDGSAWGYGGGTRWVRWSSAGTVAVPGTGNHEKRRSDDLAWPYNAVTTAHLRAREIAARHNITCDGLGFGEPWHWTFWGALGVIGSPASTGNATPIPKEWDEMASEQQIEDAAYRGARRALNERGADAAQVIQNVEFLTDQVQGFPSTDRDQTFQLATAIRSIATIKSWLSFTRVKVHSIWARTIGRDVRAGISPQDVALIDSIEGKPGEHS